MTHIRIATGAEARLLRFAAGDMPQPAPEVPVTVDAKKAELRQNYNTFRDRTEEARRTLLSINDQAQPLKNVSDNVVSDLAALGTSVDALVADADAQDAVLQDRIKVRSSNIVGLISQMRDLHRKEAEKQSNPYDMEATPVSYMNQQFPLGRKFSVPTGTAVSFQADGYGSDSFGGGINKSAVLTGFAGNYDYGVWKYQSAPGGRDTYIIGSTRPFALSIGSRTERIADQATPGFLNTPVATPEYDASAATALAGSADRSTGPATTPMQRGGLDAPGGAPPENPFAALETRRDEAEGRVNQLIDELNGTNPSVTIDGQTFNMAQLLRQMARNRENRRTERDAANAADLYPAGLDRDIQWLNKVETALKALKGESRTMPQPRTPDGAPEVNDKDAKATEIIASLSPELNRVKEAGTGALGTALTQFNRAMQIKLAEVGADKVNTLLLSGLLSQSVAVGETASQIRVEGVSLVLAEQTPETKGRWDGFVGRAEAELARVKAADPEFVYRGFTGTMTLGRLEGLLIEKKEMAALIYREASEPANLESKNDYYDYVATTLTSWDDIFTQLERAGRPAPDLVRPDETRESAAVAPATLKVGEVSFITGVEPGAPVRFSEGERLGPETGASITDGKVRLTRSAGGFVEVVAQPGSEGSETAVYINGKEYKMAVATGTETPGRRSPDTAPERAPGAIDATPIRPGNEPRILETNGSTTVAIGEEETQEPLAVGERKDVGPFIVTRSLDGKVMIFLPEDADATRTLTLTIDGKAYTFGIVDVKKENDEKASAYIEKREAFRTKVNDFKNDVMDYNGDGEIAFQSPSFRARFEALKQDPFVTGGKLEIPGRDLTGFISYYFDAADGHKYDLKFDFAAHELKWTDETQDKIDAAERIDAAKREFIGKARAFEPKVTAVVGLGARKPSTDAAFKAAVATMTDKENDPFLSAAKPEGLTDADWAGLDFNAKFTTSDGHECEIKYDKDSHKLEFTDKTQADLDAVREGNERMEAGLAELRTQAAAMLDQVKTFADKPADVAAAVNDKFSGELNQLWAYGIDAIQWPEGMLQPAKDAAITAALTTPPVVLANLTHRARLGFNAAEGKAELIVEELSPADKAVETAREQGRKVDALVKGIDDARWVVDGPRGTFRLNGISAPNYAVFKDKLAVEIRAERALLETMRMTPGLTDLQRADRYDVRTVQLNQMERKYVQLGEGRDTAVDTKEELRDAVQDIYNPIVAEIAAGKNPGQIRDMIVRLNAVFDAFPVPDIAAEVRGELMRASPTLAGPGGRVYEWKLDGTTLKLEATAESNRAAVREDINKNADAKELGAGAEREANRALAILARGDTLLGVDPKFGGEDLPIMIRLMEELRDTATLALPDAVDTMVRAETPANAYKNAINAIRAQFDTAFPGIRAMLDADPATKTADAPAGQVRIIEGRPYTLVVDADPAVPRKWTSPGQPDKTAGDVDGKPVERVLSAAEATLLNLAITAAAPAPYELSPEAGFDLRVNVNGGLRGNAAVLGGTPDKPPRSAVLDIKLKADGTVELGAVMLRSEGRTIAGLSKQMNDLLKKASDAAKGKTPKQAYDAVVDVLSAALNNVVDTVQAAPKPNATLDVIAEKTKDVQMVVKSKDGTTVLGTLNLPKAGIRSTPVTGANVTAERLADGTIRVMPRQECQISLQTGVLSGRRPNQTFTPSSTASKVVTVAN